MRRFHRALVLAAAAALALPPVGGAAVPDGPLTLVQPDLEAVMAARAGAGDTKAVKKIANLLKKFGKAAGKNSYPQEVKALVPAAKLLGKTLSGETALVEAMEQAADTITDELLQAREVLDLRARAPAKRKTPVRRLAASLVKANKFLDKAEEYGLSGETVKNALSKEFAQLARAAKLLEENLDAFRGLTRTWVITEVAVADPGEGIDLDGDGEPDNAVGELAAVLNGIPLVNIDMNEVLREYFPRVPEATAEAPVLLIQMWGFENYADPDDLVFAGLMNGVEQEGGAFDPLLTLAPDGHPILRVPTEFGPGATYEFVADGSALIFGRFAPAGDARFGVSGTARADSNDGVIGFPVAMEDLMGFIEGYIQRSNPLLSDFTFDDLNPLVRDGIYGRADLDTDGDQVNDAFSVAVAFESIPASLVD